MTTTTSSFADTEVLEPRAAQSRLGFLTLAALGVVYGDIGTSPLYAFREAFTGPHALAPSETNVYATLSALFWAVMLIISAKYVAIVLRYDNDGEGGVLALMALAHRVAERVKRGVRMVAIAGVFAAALFYGDAVITPAISVLSAIEGLSVVTPRFEHLVVPITCVILVGLFMLQRHGTGRVGTLFGPVMVFWFATLAILGAMSIAQTPGVLRAIDPSYALRFAVAKPAAAFLLLSAVFLAITGGEALYADMGHFGARPIRIAWYALVCPSLLLNYFGQGALVLREPKAVENPFYFLAPDWLLVPMVVLAAMATVIASQATITGTYSITLEATRLGYLPRMHVLHTSSTQRGQIYIPSVNWLMMIGVLVLVIEFGSSNALAAAYGVAVSGTMVITTLMVLFITLHSRARIAWFIAIALAGFAVLETLFLGSNLTKILHGGWFPLALGLAIFAMLMTWKDGASDVAAQRRKMDFPLADFLSGPQPDAPRVPGTAVYLRPIPPPCRARCSTTSSTTRCCTTARCSCT
jgi:KUP system potassium uptake protein